MRLTGAWRAGRLGLHLLAGALLTELFHRSPGSDGKHGPDQHLVEWWHRRLCRVIGLDLQVRGTPAGGGVLLVANHVSWLDIPVLGSLCRTGFLSKAEVRQWPVVGWMAAAAGTAFIRRGGHQASDIRGQLAARITAGGRVALFPEGTTTEGAGVGPFYPRLFAAALDANAPVQPVAIRYFSGETLDPVAPFVGDESFGRHLWRVLGHRIDRVEVVFCPPLQPPHGDRRRLAEAARSAIASALPPAGRSRQGVPEGVPHLARQGV